MNVPEPVRKWVYGVAGPLLAALVLWGFLSGEQAIAIGNIVAAALLIPAVEMARARVRPLQNRDVHPVE